MKRTTKKAASRKAVAKKPMAKKPVAGTTPTRAASKTSPAYLPAPIQTTGWAPFRYPPQ